MTKHLLRIGTAVMITLLGLWVLWLLRGVILYVLISLAIAGAVTPLFTKLGSYRLPARIGLILLYLLILAGFLFFLLQVGGAVVRDVQALVETLSVRDVWQQPDWLQGGGVQKFLNDRLPPPSVIVTSIAGESGQGLIPIFLGITQAIVGIVSGTLVILFLGLYWSTNRVHFEQLWLSLLPPAGRKNTRNILGTMERDLGRYIRVEFILSLIIGILLGLGYWLIGSPYPILLALVGALANFIPVIGVFIAVLTPLLIGLLSSLPISISMTLLTVVVLVGIKVWVKPRLYHQKQQNPLLIIFLLIVLADVYGLLGIIAGPPIAFGIQILWDLWMGEREGTRVVKHVIDLKERHTRLSSQIEAMENPPPILTSGLDRLNVLIERSEPILRGSNNQQE